ncbi:MAG: sugar ABC transporter permease [Peptoniphilaceae bacterium]|nr:sugar ABC transporter permease [Peptoniphilaceae bacterium]MDD7383716.1 sugar ABC transporter permease [Peptoniphilaceae bacterium]MDY3737885.1 sugar ABC transporter permease [Peptoniphilaceae bacterium]
MKYKAEKDNKAWLLLLPALLCIGVFNIYPLIRSFVMSFKSSDLFESKFVGFENFLYIVKDPLFINALKNTAIYAVTVVPLGMIISMLIALVINSKIKGSKFYETVFFIPYMTSVIAIGIVFRYLLNGDYGIINYILNLIGIKSIDFLNDPSKNLIALIIFGIWSSLAFNIIILLSGLRSIDKTYYKVADMLGASKTEIFFKVTLPFLIPVITFLLITNFISAFKVYSQIFSLFNGKAGIGNSAVSLVFYIYNKFYVESRYGQAMAAAVILFIFLIVITIIERKILKKLSK